MHASEDALDASELEQYGPTDLSPTESSLHLLGLNRTEPSAREDDSKLIRIVGGRDCAEGECPWQVTAGLGGQVAGAGEASAGHCRWLRACCGQSGPA